MPRCGRGRMRCKRWITEFPFVRNFRPVELEQNKVETIILRIEELEALRLVDAENLNQEEAATHMGVSRRTLWSDLSSARKKVATALLKGHAIRIECGAHTIIKEEI